jgi:hypothetical protein
MAIIDEQELARRLKAELRHAPPVPHLAQQALGMARQRRRRMYGAVVAGTAAVVALAVVGLYPGIGGGADRNGVDAAAVSDPWGPWIADGTLHVAGQEVAVPDIQALVAVPSGAVYATETGEVVWVRGEGTTETIGQAGSYVELVSDPDTGWVAWVEGNTDQRPELVVYDTASAAVLAKQLLAPSGARRGVLDEGSQPISIDDGTVYYAAQDGDYAWAVGTSAPQRLTSSSEYLVDHRAGVSVTRPAGSDDVVHVVHSEYEAKPVVIRGVDSGTLSPEGRYLVAHHHWLREPRIYDTLTGQRLQMSSPDGKPIVNAVFSDGGTVTYVVGEDMSEPPSEPMDGVFLPTPEGPFRLVTCLLSTGACHTSVDNAGDRVMLSTDQ